MLAELTMKRIAVDGFQHETHTFASSVLVLEALGAHPSCLDKVKYRNLRSGVRLGPRGACISVREFGKGFSDAGLPTFVPTIMDVR